MQTQKKSHSQQKIKNISNKNTKSQEISTKSKQKVSQNVYEVKKILDHMVDPQGIMFFHIQWKGYQLRDSTWEPEENLPFDLLQEYLDNKDEVSFEDGVQTLIPSKPLEKKQYTQEDSRPKTPPRKRERSRENEKKEVIVNAPEGLECLLAASDKLADEDKSSKKVDQNIKKQKVIVTQKRQGKEDIKDEVQPSRSSKRANQRIKSSQNSSKQNLKKYNSTEGSQCSNMEDATKRRPVPRLPSLKDLPCFSSSLEKVLQDGQHV